MELSIGIFPNLIDHAIQRSTDPPYGTKLLRIIGTSVSDVFRFKEHLRFLKANASLGICFEPLAFLGVEVKTQKCDNYTKPVAIAPLLFEPVRQTHLRVVGALGSHER